MPDFLSIAVQQGTIALPAICVDRVATGDQQALPLPWPLREGSLLHTAFLRTRRAIVPVRVTAPRLVRVADAAVHPLPRDLFGDAFVAVVFDHEPPFVVVGPDALFAPPEAP